MEPVVFALKTLEECWLQESPDGRIDACWLWRPPLSPTSRHVHLLWGKEGMMPPFAVSSPSTTFVERLFGNTVLTSQKLH